MSDVEETLKLVENDYATRMKDPFFKGIIEEFNKITRELRDYELGERLDTKSLREELQRASKETRHIASIVLEYILEADMLCGPITPVEIATIIDCLLYLVWSLNEEEIVKEVKNREKKTPSTS